jgi:hypothetical protein
MPKSPAPLVILGFDLKTVATSAPVTITIEVYLADAAGQPQIPPAVTGSMPISTTYQMHRGTLTRPIVVPANAQYFIGFADGGMQHPICTSGTTRTAYYWHAPNATTWNGGTTVQNWAYRLNASGCAPSADYAAYGAGCTGAAGVPLLGNTGVPKVGLSFTVDLSKAAASAPTLLFLGVSDSVWGAFTLPLDLTVLGAPGCKLLASGEVLIFAGLTSASGTLTSKLDIPNVPALAGFRFYNQFLIRDVPANKFGWALSNGGRAVVGN